MHALSAMICHQIDGLPAVKICSCRVKNKSVDLFPVRDDFFPEFRQRREQLGLERMPSSDVVRACSGPLHMLCCICLRPTCRVPLGCAHHADDQRFGCKSVRKLVIVETSFYAELKGNLRPTVASYSSSVSLWVSKVYAADCQIGSTCSIRSL